jgi:YhcH/YjgK/YiaL family protein
MVIDKLENAHIYYGMGSRIEKALKYLENLDSQKIKPGRYEIEDTSILAICEEYITKPIESGFWEGHRKYIDIQFIADGTELIGYSNINKMKESVSYDEDRDIQEFQGEGEFYRMDKNSFMILLPHDIHMPGRLYKEPNNVKKIIMKVSV